MLPGPLRVRWVFPVHLIQARQRAPEVRQVESTVGVVMRQMARSRPVRPHVYGGEGLVGQRVDVSPCPRSGRGPARERQYVDRDADEAHHGLS